MGVLGILHCIGDVKKKNMSASRNCYEVSDVYYCFSFCEGIAELYILCGIRLGLVEKYVQDTGIILDFVGSSYPTKGSIDPDSHPEIGASKIQKINSTLR